MEQMGDILRRAGYRSYVRILRDALKSEGPPTIQLYHFYVHAESLYMCLIALKKNHNNGMVFVHMTPEK